jgi:hypothetical protein
MSRLVARYSIQFLPTLRFALAPNLLIFCRGLAPVSSSCLLRTLPRTVFVVASALALAIPRAAEAQTGAYAAMPYLSGHTLIVGEPCVQHLLGRHTEAASTIRDALAADAGFAPDLRWHARSSTLPSTICIRCRTN